MSDSKDTNELDSYGVWVKTPPKTVDSSDSTQNDDIFNIETDLPDFSELDVVDDPLSASDYDNSDTALSTEELFKIANEAENAQDADAAEPAQTETAAASGGEEEISLDEFIEGGVFETGPDEDKIKEKEAEKAAQNAETPAEENTESASEDISFDDDFTVQADEPEAEEDAAAESFETESKSDDDIFNIDLSFDDDSSDSAETEQPAQDISIPEEDKSEDITFDSPEGTEDVDLSEFGFDDSSDEQSQSTQATAEPGEQTETAAPVEETVDADDDDFDLDSILGNITDENGNTTSLSDSVTEDAAEFEDVEPIAEIEPDTEESAAAEDTTVIEESEFTTEPEIAEDAAVIEEPAVTEDASAAEEPELSAGPVIADEQTITEESAPADLPADEIPDTFDEETSSFFDEDSEKATEFASSIKAPVLTEDETGNEEKPSAQMTAIFSQIVGELSSLKNEFASLKNEIEELKSKSPAPLSIEEPETEESHGFFSDTDEDDTIALSTDELDNILQTADISQAEPAETDDFNEAENPLSQTALFETSDENIEDSGAEPELINDESAFTEPAQAEEIEEPTLDNLDYSNLEEHSDLPEEISVPKADDILVESSSTDLLDGTDTSDGITEDPFAELTAEEPSIEETLTDDKIDYLTETPAQDDDFSALADLPSDIPAEDITPAEIENTETAETSAEPATTEPEEQSMPGDLKNEIKSVLSYMDQLLENLPEEKIAEFAQSEQFDTYKKLFKELGLA